MRHRNRLIRGQLKLCLLYTSDIIVDDEVGQLDRPADAAFFAEGERYLRGTLGDAAYNRIMSEPADTPEDDTPPK